MKQIIIHCRNEEIAGIEPLADKLRRQGAHVRFLAIKWRERDPKADIALCPEYLLPVVEEMYASQPNAFGRKVAVRVLEADLSEDSAAEPAPAPVVVEASAVADSPLAALNGNIQGLTTSALPPVEGLLAEIPPSESEAQVEVSETDEGKPAPAPRRRK